MTLSPGDKLGPYEVVASLGAGGMGEVYRAHDSRLDRDVAVKVSKQRFSERFEREARAVAALNHPNICHIYDVGPDYLVLELVEGESPKGPLPLDEALKIAQQIADALEAAHEKGIVHRDLKPGNILIKPDQSVKVLDFGLAKVASATGSPVSEDSPTQAMTSTQPGVILGTAAYMSPEQARGKSVTSRSDIWAFGVVLYEMLTGRRLFAGEDLAEVLASVVKEQPDLSAAPVEVQRLLRACLEKDPRNRLRAIGDWKLLLDRSQTAAAQNHRVSKLWPVLTGLLAIAAAYTSWLHFHETPAEEYPMRFSVALPPGAQPSDALLSPDGRRLLVRMLSQNKVQLYTRLLDATDFNALEGTDGARMPFWSPDSRFIAFFADGKLRKMPAGGGPVSILCGETGLGANGGAWSPANVILYFSDERKPFRVSPMGGDCAPVTLGDQNLRGSLPQFMPDGTHFFFLGASVADSTNRGVYLGSLEGGKPRRILDDYSSVLYAPPRLRASSAHLLFLRGSELMAQAFNPRDLEVVGDAFPMTPQVSRTFSVDQMAVSVAANGALAYVSNSSRQMQLTWFDRFGTELGKLGEPAVRMGVSLSPDGNTVAILERSQVQPLGGLELLNVGRNTETRFTPEGKSAAAAVWSPDGARIVYSAPDKGVRNLFMRNANGEGPETRLLPPGTKDRTPSDWSDDGRFLIYTEIDPNTGPHLWYLPNPGMSDAEPVRFLAPDVAGTQGQLSPDGHWLAYTGAGDAVYVRRFPSGDLAMKISDRAHEPRWSKDGRELFYLERSNGSNLMEVVIRAAVGGTPQFDTPRKIMTFRGRSIVPQNNSFAYSPHPDGKRFLVNVIATDAAPEINVITNWQGLAGTRKP